MGGLNLFATNTAFNTTSIALTVPARGLAVGSTLLIVWADGANQVNVTGIADTGSNTYTKLLDSGDNGAGLTERLQLWSAPITTALVSGNTITLTLSSNPGDGICAVALEITTLVNFALDQSSIAAADNTNSPSSGTTASLLRVDELVIGAIGRINGSSTLSGMTADYTILTDLASGVGLTDQALRVAYRIAKGETTGQVFAATISSNRDNAALVAAFKFERIGPPPVPYGGNPFLHPLEKRRYVQ